LDRLCCNANADPNTDTYSDPNAHSNTDAHSDTDADTHTVRLCLCRKQQW
jgi:hypothetical protein